MLLVGKRAGDKFLIDQGPFLEIVVYVTQNEGSTTRYLNM